MAHLVGDGGEVHAFDPHPQNIRRLMENVDLNHRQNVIINRLAVSDSTGAAPFNFGNGSTVSSLKALAGQKQDWHPVETVSVDDYLMRQIGRRVAFIKIDVEGAEDLVLQGMQNTLSTHRPTLFLEFHQFAFEAAEAEAMLTPLFARYGYFGRVLHLLDVRNRQDVRYRMVPEHEAVTTQAALAELAKGAHTVGLLLTSRSS
jgi:FkbM family methyltransferase